MKKITVINRGTGENIKKITVVNRETGETQEWNAENVKSYCKPESIQNMRNDERHHLFSFIIEFKGLSYDMGMWEVDKYDLVVE